MQRKWCRKWWSQCSIVTCKILMADFRLWWCNGGNDCNMYVTWRMLMAEWVSKLFSDWAEIETKCISSDHRWDCFIWSKVGLSKHKHSWNRQIWKVTASSILNVGQEKLLLLCFKKKLPSIESFPNLNTNDDGNWWYFWMKRITILQRRRKAAQGSPRWEGLALLG